MQPGHSPGVRRLLAHAQKAAGNDRHSFIHTEHLLMGLLAEANSATRILKAQGQDRQHLRRECERRSKKGHHQNNGQIRLTSRGQDIMGLAAQEMEAMGDSELDTRHVLLGMLLEKKGIAGSILRDAGVTADAARDLIAGEAARVSPQKPEPSLQPDAAETRKPLWKQWLRV